MEKNAIKTEIFVNFWLFPLKKTKVCVPNSLDPKEK